MTRRLYAVTLPRGTQTAQDGRAQQQQSIQALLGGDVGDVTQLGSDPEEQPLTIEFVDELAGRRAAEVRELAQGLSQPLPYYGVDRGTPADGYWSVSGVSRAAPVDPRVDGIRSAEITLQREGTPASHWRRVRAVPGGIDHDFGVGDVGEVGVPTAARKVRWFDPETETTAPASALTTRTTANGDVAIYDVVADAPSIPAELLYEIDFADEGLTDPRVFDTFGEGDKFEFGDPSQALQWQKVFAPSHQYRGERVVTNGLFRLQITEQPAGGTGLTAEEYTSGSWSAISVDDTGWAVFDWDIRSIGTATIGGIAEFTDGSSFHTVEWSLSRGYDRLLIDTENTPSGLVTTLDSLAKATEVTPYGSLQATPAGLREREVVK